MATTVTYNDVVLHNVTTREWVQTVEYDQSNTDEMCQKFRLTFEAIIHTGTPEILGVFSAYQQSSRQLPLGDVYTLLIRKLKEPRRHLLIVMGEDEERILEVKPYAAQGNRADSAYDVSNGPRPIDVTITHVASNKVFRILFTIECSIMLCESGATPNQLGNVLNNRWRIDEEMDQQFFTTRTITGRLRIASAILAGHMAKYLVVPPLEMGFRRETMQYVVHENGLDCDYVVRDKQVHTAAPWPGVEIDGRHTESTHDGVTFVAEMTVRLTGSPAADKTVLIQRAVQIVDSRLNVIQQKDEETPDHFMRHAAIIDHIGAKNMIEVQVRIQRTPPGTGKEAVAFGEFLTSVVAERLGQRLELPPLDGVDYDPRVSRLPYLYGEDPHTGVRVPSAALLALHCYLQTPCSPSAESHSISQSRPYEAEGDQKTKTLVTGATKKGYLPTNDSKDNYSKDTRKSIYALYELENVYTKHVIRVQAPYAIKAKEGDDTCGIFQLASGQAVRQITLEAERVGSWPQIPEPKDTYKDGKIKGYLILHEEHTQPPTLSADGRHKLFKIEAVYRWALNRFPKKNEESNTGVLAFTNFSQQDNALTRSDIYDKRLAP